MDFEVLKKVDPIGALNQHQEGCCAVCQEPRKRLYIDHDHDTGLIRGLLCNGCNTSEGRDFRAPWFREYRNNPPAAQIGIEVQYGRQGSLSTELVFQKLPGKSTVDKLAAAVHLGVVDPKQYWRDSATVEEVTHILNMVGEAVLSWEKEALEEKQFLEEQKKSSRG